MRMTKLEHFKKRRKWLLSAAVFAALIAAALYCIFITAQKTFVTEYSYKSPSLQITIEPIVTTDPNIHQWITHVILKSPKQLKTAFANDRFGSREKTSITAAGHHAILAVNASAFSYADNKPIGVVIKNGVIYRGGAGAPMCIRKDGTFGIPNVEVDAGVILKAGVTDTFNFGPLLVNGGKKVYIYDGMPTANYPRTAIGQVSPTEYYLITADGKRDSYSVGLTPYQLQDEFIKRKCKFAYNLDGGGSTTLYFNGKVLNSPSDASGEREVSDIIYFINKT